MGYKILLADDSITIQKVVELILSEEDCTITSVNNGDEAFEIAKRDKPDIILADIIMPKTDGYQLCEKVKEYPDLMNTPVLLLAGAYESFDTSRASAVGADDYIIKPFESQELIKKVKDCIERGAKPLSKGPAKEVAKALDEDLWASTDLTSKAEVAETEFFKGIEATEEAEEIGEALGEALAEEKVEEEELEGLIVEEKEEVLEEPAPFKAEIGEVKPHEISEEAEIITVRKAAITVEPVSAQIVKEEIGKTAEKILKESFISITPEMIRSEIIKRVDALLKEALPGILQTSSLEIGKAVKDALDKSLDITLKDIIEKVSWEVIPDVAERVVKGVIEASITSSIRETLEKVAWEVVPDMAEILITKEIERLKAGE